MKSLFFSFETNFSRDNFEFICEKLFNKIEKLLKSFLENQSENVKDLDFVVLVGGSSRIKKFQALVGMFIMSMVTTISN